MLFEQFLGSIRNGALAEAASDGHLLDIYSDEWLNASAGRRCGFLSASKLRQEFGEECFHHLFILCIADSPRVRASFLEIAPELQWQFVENKHEPDFIFVNTREQMTLSVGLGRKNRLFALDCREDVKIDANFLEDRCLCRDPTIEKFIRNDHGRAVWTLSGGLERLGDGYYYDEPKLVVANRVTVRAFFPFLDTRTLNTRDY